jgi:3-(3-hydroxy-phenyl)propionate hydroxylase
LNTPDTQAYEGRMRPGTNCADAPISVDGQAGWLLNQLGQGFVLLSFGPASPVTVGNVTARVLEVGKDLIDSKGLIQQRYDGQPGTVYLIRPDQHVAARWRAFDAAAVTQALRRALKLN